MRKALIASLALAAALIVVAAATGRPPPPTTAAAAGDSRLREGQLGLLDSTARSRSARTTRPSRPGSGATRRQAVEGQRPVQRQGLRVRRRLRGREAARLREERRSSGRTCRSTTRTAREEVVRLLHHAGLVQARSARRRSTSRTATTSSTSRSSAARASRSRRCARSTGSRIQARRAVGTTSYDYIVNQIKPTSKPHVYDTNDAAVQALKNGQIDGLVVDLPTAFYVTAVQVPDGKVIGQFAAGGRRSASGSCSRRATR